MKPGRNALLSTACLLALVIGACTARPRAADSPARSEAPRSGTDDQDAPSEIRWTPYDEAFALARREDKPVVVVFTAAWCGHCRTYQGVLDNPEVIALSRQAVMVRVDIDERPDVNARHLDDGGYVPRTHFFRPDGSPIAELRAANRTRYVHFLDTQSPAELLSLMRRAIAG